MEKFLRFFLPAYFIAYLGAAFFWRSYLVWKQTGVNPFVLGKEDNAHDFIGRMFKLTFALIALVVLIYSLANDYYRFLIPVFWLEKPVIQLVGLALLVVSLLWTLVAQAQMGDSWRIGIDEKNKTRLVKEGVYAFSRNPIFLGMSATLVGLVLLMPNAFSLLLAGLGITMIQIQVRLEEGFLTKTHGEDYLNYRQETRRWM